jgi:hypothetical protein
MTERPCGGTRKHPLAVGARPSRHQRSPGDGPHGEPTPPGRRPPMSPEVRSQIRCPGCQAGNETSSSPLTIQALRRPGHRGSERPRPPRHAGIFSAGGGSIKLRRPRWCPAERVRPRARASRVCRRRVARRLRTTLLRARSERQLHLPLGACVPQPAPEFSSSYRSTLPR